MCYKKVVEKLEVQYASVEDHGVPISVYLQLQQLEVKLCDALWTARHSLGGFSIWPAQERNQTPQKVEKKEK